MYRLRRICLLGCLTLMFKASVLSAQISVPDSLLRAAQTEAPHCKITEIRRLPGDTLFVALLDSLLSYESYQAGEWVLCDGASRDLKTKQASLAIVGPLWSAWGINAGIKIAVLDIRSATSEEAHIRLAFPAPTAAEPHTVSPPQAHP